MLERFRPIIAAAVALSAAGAAHAHTGHPVAEGVDARLHTHLSGAFAAEPEWVLASVAAVAAVGWLCWRAHRTRLARSSVPRARSRGRAR